MASASSHVARKLLLFLVIFASNLLFKSANYVKDTRELYRNKLVYNNPWESIISSDKCELSVFSATQILCTQNGSAGHSSIFGSRDFHGMPRCTKSAGKQTHVEQKRGVPLLSQLVLLLTLAGDVQTNPGPLPGSEINFFYSNVQSILGAEKLDNFNKHFSDGHLYDIVAATETWLNDSVLDTEILSDNYSVYRGDRAGGRVGGGAMLAMSARLRSRPLTEPAPPIPGCEQAWCTIALEGGQRLAAGVLYVPPAPDQRTIENINATLAAVRSGLRDNDSLVLFGDFNMPNIEWYTDQGGLVFPMSMNMSPVNNMFLELLAEQDFNQHVATPTRGTNFLDLIFTNKNIGNLEVSPTPTFLKLDHTPLDGVLTTDSPPLRHIPNKRVILNWRRADIEGLKNSIRSMPLNLLRAADSSDECNELFYDFLDAAIKDNVPTISVHPARFPRWFDDNVIQAYKAKHRAHKRYKRTGSDMDYFIFSSKRRDFKIKADFAHSAYIRNMEENLKANPRSLFSFMQSKSKSKRLPNLMTFDQQQFTDLKQIANVFSQFFKDNFSRVQNICNFSNDINFTNVRPFMVIKPCDIIFKILKLKCGKSTGSDKIPVNVLKVIANEISDPLSIVYNKIICTGIYPSSWKLAKVNPVFKKGVKSAIKNYRPISILPVFSKVFEGFLYDYLFGEISCFLPASQHGFLPKKSTVTNLTEYTHMLSENFKQKLQTDSIYIDFAKAFDRVPHIPLINKLHKMGVNQNLLFLLRNYLRDRTQVVEIDGVRSDIVHVTSGVIQGSILGPLLFSAYVWDLPACLEHAQCSMYADDSKIFSTIKNVSDSILLQNDLGNLHDWCKEWQLDLNLEKCQSITFTNKPNPLQFHYYLGDRELERVEEVSDLGITLTSDLNYDNHINTICKKAARMLGFIRRSCRDFQPDTLRQLYISLVRPMLEYASVVWSPHHANKIDRIERIQRAFLRAWCYKSGIEFRKENYHEHCSAAGVVPLYNRRDIIDILLLYKILRGQVDSSYLLRCVCLHAPARATREPLLFKPPFSRIDVCKHHFCYRAQKLYCELLSRSGDRGIDIFHMSFELFRKNIYRHF